MKQVITKFLLVTALVLSFSVATTYFTQQTSAGVDSGYKVANDLDWQLS